MTASLFDLFKIGIGPSSSHTMGPMTAADRFTADLAHCGLLPSVARVTAELYGSLALTGKGHATDRAILAGLSGHCPETIPPGAMDALWEAMVESRMLHLAASRRIAFDPDRDLLFHQRQRLPFHSNALRFTAYGATGEPLHARLYYSVGGGMVVDEESARANRGPEDKAPVPYPFASARALLALCEEAGLTIAELVLANEAARQPLGAVEAGIARVEAAMRECIEAGLMAEGILPGGLRIRRRAAAMARDLTGRRDVLRTDPLAVLDWVSCWALAVNEENAAGGRVVTAPTNGAAGIIPAVLRYLEQFTPTQASSATRDFLLVASAVGHLFRENASISAAEVGCQGEVGVACSMAAGGLAAALGGTNAQVENAAEIAMEHNLGLTCDPIAGLVQVPCIERNAMGAVKAIEAARLALAGDGRHHVSLDEVIETMRRTGADMSEHYKETSKGGLALNLVEC